MQSCSRYLHHFVQLEDMFIKCEWSYSLVLLGITRVQLVVWSPPHFLLHHVVGLNPTCCFCDPKIVILSLSMFVVSHNIGFIPIKESMYRLITFMFLFELS